jgi:hypothetical protein
MINTSRTVVLKTSWPGLDRRHSEANMFSACNGRFGVIPHVCSYEATGKFGEVISNILFFPEESQLEEYFWPIFCGTPPEGRDIRTYNSSILGPDGKLFTDAENPRELSRAWADSLLGAFTATLLHQLD